MDLLQLKLFVSVAHTLNFSRTAEEFYTTQPSVSHHIRALEEKLGVPLLQRNSHGVRLTREGAEYLPYAMQMINLSSEAEQRVQNVAQGRIGRIRIAALSSASYELTDCLTPLYQSYPHIQADVDLLEGTDMINALTRNSYDFYYAVEPMIPAGGQYHYSVISREPLHLFIHRKDVADIDMDDWNTIQRHPFVSVPQSDSMLASQVRTICRNRKCSPRTINYYNRAEAVVLSVNLGIGLSILPAPLRLLYQRPNVVTMPISGEDAMLTSVFAWKDEESSTACEIFRDLVLSLYPQEGDAGTAGAKGRKAP